METHTRLAQLTNSTLRSNSLEHDPNGIGKPTRVMRRVPRQQEHFSFSNDDIPSTTVLDNLENHRSLVLVEPFFGLVEVEIGSRVGTSDDHDGKVFAAVDTVVAWWFERKR